VPYWSEVSRRLQLIVLGIALVVGVGIGAAVAVTQSSSAPASPVVATAPALGNPMLDPGTRLRGAAPGFTLTDQFGKRVSLRSFRGKVVVLSFNDPECTTICPLTTTALLRAKALLGPAGSQVQLLGIGANPDATQVKWVRAYSRVHGMLHKWHFLTGSLPQLRGVWHAYGIEAAVLKGLVDHTPATYVIDTRGRESRLFVAQMAYSSVPQLAYEMAQSIAALLPGHPHLRSSEPLAEIRLLGPRTRVTLPRSLRGGAVRLGPGSGPHLLLFFNTWDSEVTDLGTQLLALNRYQAAARSEHLPPLAAIDEASVEPSTSALPDLLRKLPALSYPVAADASGRVGDGYAAQDSPWLTLVSGSGKLLFYEDLAVKGWPTLPQLLRTVHAALAHAKASRRAT
jgi:cytochrome oxidase Cu insertion factor (SCO1/SenC/PrrC family)